MSDVIPEIMEHDYPILRAFHERYGIPPKARPSCLVCGFTVQDWPPAIRHMELPGIVVCKPCYERATGETPAPQQFDPLRNFAEWCLGAVPDAPRMVEHIIENARGALEQAGSPVNAPHLRPHDETAAENVDEYTVMNLSMFVRRLARLLRKHEPDSKAATQALDFLERIGMRGTPLRVGHETKLPR